MFHAGQMHMLKHRVWSSSSQLASQEPLARTEVQRDTNYDATSN